MHLRKLKTLESLCLHNKTQSYMKMPWRAFLSPTRPGERVLVATNIEMSQDLNPSTCSSLVIFIYWACENRTFNATPTEKLQQYPLVFAMNRTHCMFFCEGCTWHHLHILVKAPLCCDWKGRAASAQSFLLSHQATIKIPRRAHLISACSRHMGAHSPQR